MTEMPESTESATNGRTRALNIATVLIGLTFLSLGTWATWFAALRNDQYQLIHLGQTVRRGGLMYVDAWENKPPGIAWINAAALAMSGDHPMGPWLMPGAVAVVVLGLVWYSASRLFGNRTGRRSVLIAALVYSLRIYDAPSINPDFYSSILELAASAAWLLALFGGEKKVVSASRRATLWMLVSGLLWAAAATVKQVGCVGLLTATIATGIHAVLRSDFRTRCLRGIVVAWAGFLVGLAVVASVLASQGVLDEASAAVFTFNRELAGWDSLRQVLHGSGRLRADLAPLAAFLWLGVVGIAVGVFAERPRRSSSAVVPTMLLWWLAACAFALIGPSGSMRYWQATFPPMIWLAGLGVHHVQEVQERLDRHHRFAFIVVSTTALILLMRPMLYEVRASLAASYVQFDERPNERDRLVEVGRAIAEMTDPGDLIYVWAFHAGVYVHADRSAAARFTYPRSSEQMDDILRCLEEKRGSMILVPRRSPEFAAFCDESCRQRFQDILKGFVPSAPIGSYEVWLR